MSRCSLPGALRSVARPARRSAWAAVLAAAPLLAAAQAPAPLSPLSLPEALALASAQSPLLAASHYPVQAAQDMARAAGQRPDPVLSIGIDNLPVDGADRFKLTRDFMTMRTLGVVQELTRGSKLQARSARAEREADVARSAARELRARVQRDTALAWLERAYQHDVQALLLELQTEAALQVQASEALYRGGKAALVDVLAARGQAAQAADRSAQAGRAGAVATAQLARWIGDAALRPPGPQPVFERPAWGLGDDPGAGTAPPQARLDHHPQIEAAQRRQALAQADADLAAAERAADWSVGLQFSQRGPAYSNMVSVNLSLPLQWSRAERQDRELAARQALVKQAAAELAEAQRTHTAEVQTVWAEWRGHEDRLRHFDSSLLPLAQQRTEAALAAYRGGGGGLAAVLEARRNEAETRAERLRIGLDIARAWAQLGYLIPAAETTAGGAP
jgi:outer membrane protein TolC